MSTTASWLAGGRHRFNELFFGLRQIDAGAISAQESRFGDRHFFAFELTCDAHNGNDYIGVFRRGYRLRRRRVVRFGPNQFSVRLAVGTSVGDAEGDLVALFQGGRGPRPKRALRRHRMPLPPACRRL
jgi:hypothetical protein